ncbi:MAG: GNAT family N-acetyltransferase [Cellvibrio sp. 79]|nr:MAG: GNAT family N-acetyltransferase [Cellvibrio sp. 79]
MEILKASLPDAEQILALQKQAYYSEAELNNDFSIPPLTQALEQLRTEFDVKEILKVVHNGELVGSGQVKLENGTALIGRIIVRPDLWGQGIGSRILYALESVFSNAKRFELFTGAQSVKNIAFYKRHGYIEYKEAHLGKTKVIFLEKFASARQIVA